MPEISIVVPVYNVEPYLRRCIDSVLAQTFKDFNLILVDDGSTDNSGIICDEYSEKDERIIVFHQTNQGQAKARNVALDWIFANNDSKYISFIDSDDWVHERYLELLYKAIQIYGTNISQSIRFETDGNKEIPLVTENMDCITVEDEYINWYFGTIWGKLYNIECFRKIRFPEGQIYEDVAIWYKLLFAEKQIALVKEVLYYYFINENSTVRKEWTPSRFARIKAWDEQIVFLSKFDNERILKNAVSRYCWILKWHYDEVNRSSCVNAFVKNKYKYLLKLRMWKALLMFGSEIRSNGMCGHLFSWIFPRLSWCFWTMIGITNKIKRILKQHEKK